VRGSGVIIHGKELISRPRLRCKNNIKIYFVGIG
jgi:RNase P/RNase MRP subunit p29